MSSSSFINALRRFVAIRGSVKIIRSDRGTNFIGAANTLNLNRINIEVTTSNSYLEEKRYYMDLQRPPLFPHGRSVGAYD